MTLKITLKKKQVRSALKKAILGVKKGYQQTSAYIGKHGPEAHNRLKRMSESIGETFAIQSNPQAPRPDFRVKPYRLPRMLPKKRPDKVDWNNLGMRF